VCVCVRERERDRERERERGRGGAQKIQTFVPVNKLSLNLALLDKNKLLFLESHNRFKYKTLSFTNIEC